MGSLSMMRQAVADHAARCGGRMMEADLFEAVGSIARAFAADFAESPESFGDPAEALRAEVVRLGAYETAASPKDGPREGFAERFMRFAEAEFTRAAASGLPMDARP